MKYAHGPWFVVFNYVSKQVCFGSMRQVLYWLEGNNSIGPMTVKKQIGKCVTLIYVNWTTTNPCYDVTRT